MDPQAALTMGQNALYMVLMLAAPVSIPRMFLLFVKIGSVLYGSGYVLIAFMQSEFVQNLGWLTNQQLLDAIIVGQITPGPVFTVQVSPDRAALTDRAPSAVTLPPAKRSTVFRPPG